MRVFELKPGDGPLLVSIPHSGQQIPECIAEQMTAIGRRVPDTDWYVDRLYQLLWQRPDVSVIKANYSRYVVDLNRPADGAVMYPGSQETGLCPLTTFTEQPIYRDGQHPDASQVDARVARYWRPYHQQIEQQLTALRRRHGYALLWDAHSIASRVPLFFDGRVPDYSFGTDDGRSCAPQLLDKLLEQAEISRLEAVANQRFKGGYITRHYGNSNSQVHAVQLELSQRCYMNEINQQFERRSAKSTANSIVGLLDGLLRAAEALFFSSSK